MIRRAMLLLLAAVALAPAALLAPAAASTSDFDAAAWRARLEANRADADSLVALGAEAARAGNPRCAVRAYKRAIALAPERRATIAASLAYQYAWSGALDRALREFAVARAAQPENVDLRRGELLVRNWMGDHLAAWQGYDALVSENGDVEGRAEAWVELAAAQNWAGRRDLALRSTQWALNLDRDNREARELDASIRAGLRPRAGLFHDWSEDSDLYQVNGLWAEAGASLHPQLTLTPFVNVQGIRRAGQPDIDETWGGATVAAQPFTRAALWARAAWLTDPARGADGTPVVALGAIDVRPHDRVRLGASIERFAVVSYRVYPEKITGTTFAVFAEARPEWLTRARLSVDRAFYDAVDAADGATLPANHRWNAVGTLSREVWSPARVRVGLFGRALSFRRTLDYGIWTPHRFGAGAVTAEWDWGVRDRWSVNGGLDLGLARETGGKTTLYAGYRLGGYRSFGAWTLELSAGHTEGNVETGAGYDRSWSHVGLRRRF